MNERNHENFIMLPTVDFCFKELMKNPKVRKGFIRWMRFLGGKDRKEFEDMAGNAAKKREGARQ